MSRIGDEARVAKLAGFGIEIETCARGGGTHRIPASIKEPAVIAGILSHLQRTVPQSRLR